MRRLPSSIALLAGVALLAAPLTDPARAADRDKKLERGMALVEAGEYKKALADLSDAVSRLSRDPSRKLEAADACLYSGLAYIGLGETSPAISQFAQALMRNPKIQIPMARESQAATDAFEVARREAVAPPEPGKGPSKTAWIVGGAAVVAGGAAALLAGGGGGSGTENPNPVPPVFTATTGTGTPQMLLLGATPPSSSTVNLRQTAPTLSFVFNYQANLPGRLKATAEMVGPGGICMNGHSSEDAIVDPATPTYTLVVNSWQISCSSGFITTSMNVRLVDADANIPVSLTSFTGGYIFTLQ